MNRTLRILLLGGATFLVILLYGFSDTESSDPSTMYTDDPYDSGAYYADEPARPSEQQEAVRTSSGQGQRVTLMDRGLQMPRGTQVVPEGWDLTQDLATDPNTGGPARDVLDIRGPRGELIRALGIGHYAQMMGTSLQQVWRQLAMQRLQGELADVTLGDLQRSETLARTQGYQRVAQMVGQSMRMEALEAPLRARHQGQAVEGVVYLMHFTSPELPAGTVQATAVLSPAGLLPETLRLNEQIADGFEPNPAYEQRLRQISQQVMQRQNAQHQQWMANSQAQHQQRMANNRAQFGAHQQMMQGRYDAADMQMQSWQAQQRSGDEMHRRTINGINETVDLYDAQSGQTHYGVQSGYDAYWTDPTGNVVGTQGYDNPDVMRYNQATDLDDVHRQGGYDGGDGW